ncbi:MAG: mRNA surveillance protein pelota [Candidatus Micrarchaeia archaeon]
MMRAKINRKDGIVSVVPETFEDVWNVYKLITKGATVSARTNRKYKPPGSNREERISIYVILEAEKVDLSKYSNSIRVTGKIVEARPEYVAPIGAYHTIDVGIGDEVSIRKEWKDYEIEALENAIKASRRSILNIIVMDDEKATFASIRMYGVEFGIEIENTGKKVDKNIPTDRYFHEVLNEMKRIDGKIILGGPGFTKENFYNFARKESPDTAKRILLVSASNAEKSGVYEVIRSDEIRDIMEEEQVRAAVRDIETFLKSIGKEDGLSVYGKKEVEKCSEMGAIEKLIIVDSLVRSDESYEMLIDNVKSKGGSVLIVPEESQVALQLNAFGGVVALLRFKVR